MTTELEQARIEMPRVCTPDLEAFSVLLGDEQDSSMIGHFEIETTFLQKALCYV